MSDAGADFNPHDLDLAELRPVIVAVAERVLTERQLHIFVLHFFKEQSVKEVAHCLGITHQVVSEAITGRATGKHPHPGILKKVGDALKNDATFQDTLEDLKKPTNQRKAKGVDVVGWYRGCQAHHFQALAVLHYAVAMSDAREQVTVDELFAHIPRGAVGGALSMLKVLGFVAFDGRTVTILKTPLTAQKEGL